MADATAPSIANVEEGRQRLVPRETTGNRNRARARRTRDPCRAATQCRAVASSLGLIFLVVGITYLKNRIENMHNSSMLVESSVAIACVWIYVGLLYLMETWAPTEMWEFLARVLSIVSLIVFGVYADIAVKTTTYKDLSINGGISFLFLTIFTGLSYYSCRRRPFFSAPSSQRRAPTNRNRSEGGQATSIPLQTLVSTRTERQDSEPEATRQTESTTDSQTADQSSKTLGEKDAILQTSVPDEASAVKVSEVASAISQIVSESEKGESVKTSASSQSSQKSESEKGESVKTSASSQSSQKSESETELLSSGEVRRRKFLNPDELSRSSNSSDEEPKKE